MPSEQYEHDVTEAGKRAQRMRRGGDLSRVLWLLNEKASWNLAISGEIDGMFKRHLEATAEIIERLAAIQAKLDEGVSVDLGPTNALLQQILDLLAPGDEGEAESLNLTLGEPEPN